MNITRFSNELGIISVLTFTSIFWCLYNSVLRPKDPKKKHLMGNCIVNYPKSIKKSLPIMAKRFKKIKFDECFDAWSLSHLFIYFLSGIIIPNKYGFVLILSVLCEIFEYFAGYRAKMSDLFVNFIGYWLGSNVKINFFRNIGLYLINNTNKTIFSLPILFLLLSILVIVRKKEWV